MRKEERILNALSDVKEEYIEAVEWEEKPKRWAKWIGLAASVVILLFLAFHVPEELVAPNPPDTENLMTEQEEEQLDVDWVKGPNGEDLQVITAAFDLGAMGSGQVSEDELDTGNPWNETMEIDTLPVYKNLAYYSPAGEPVYFSREQLLEMAQDVAEKLGTKVTTWEYGCVMEKLEKGDVDVYQITAITDLGEIAVSGNGKIYISFYEPVLWENKDKLLDAVDYDSEIEEFLGHFFNAAYFYGDEENGLRGMRYGDVRVAAELLGDYPIITSKEAKECLKEGCYIANFNISDEKDRVINDDAIKSVELVYMTSSVCQYYQPYYCFYVELEEVGYGKFYVPALESKYLADFEELYPFGN